MVLATLAALAVSTIPGATVRGIGIPATRSIGVLRINPRQPIPKDLRGVRYLLLDAARARRVAGLKKRYPRLRVLAYKNLSFLIDYSRSLRGNAGVPWRGARKSWFLRDQAGRRVRSVHFRDAWFADVGSRSYQRALIRDVLRLLRAAPWDGVFMDDALADPGWHLGGRYERLARYPTRNAYRAAERSLLVALQPALTRAGYLEIANVGAGSDQADVWSDWAGLVSGEMDEHFLKPGKGTEPVVTGASWTAAVAIEQAVEGAGRSFLALSYGPRSDTAAQGYVRASFLLFDRPETASASIWSPHATPTSNLDLGIPLSDAVQNGETWTRPFSGGVLSVDPTTGTYSVRAP